MRAVPQMRATVERHVEIAVSYYDRDRDFHSRQVRGYSACTWQHEYDHLDDILFPNRVTDMRALCNVEERSIEGSVFGKTTKVPFDIAPMGMCNLSSPGADLMLAHYAVKYETPVCVSTVASTSLEAMIEEAQGHAWFQLYYGGDEDVSRSLVDRTKDKTIAWVFSDLWWEDKPYNLCFS